MKYIGENAIKKLISLIKGDLATKQPTITASGLLKGDGAGTVTAADTQEATLVDVPNGLLKGDGTTISAAVAGTDYVVPSTALNELPGHLGNTSIHVTASDKENWNSKPSIVISEIPKGRMRGDINGTGKVGTGDDLSSSQYYNTKIDPANPDGWACDIDGDGYANSADISALISGQLYSTPLIADYYNNWTYHKVDNKSGYWTTDLVIPGITAETDVSISVQGNVLKNTFIKAEPLSGGVRIHANYPPIRSMPCSVTYCKGTGQGSICAVEGISDLEERETKAIRVKLLAANWSSSDKTQTVAAPGVNSSPRNQQLILTPVSNKLAEYYNAGILCIGRANGELTFKCETIPTADIFVFISITPVTFVS